MLILDTNHFSEIERQSRVGQRLSERLAPFREETFISIVTAEEVLRGWLSAIQPHRQSDLGIQAYGDFQHSLQGFQDWYVLPWNEDSASIFRRLKAQKFHIGTKDACIASIALEYNATLLTRNLVDFQKVPDLKVENWLD